MNIKLTDSTIWALKRALPKAITSLSADIQNLAREIDELSLKEPQRAERVKHHDELEQEQDDLVNLLAVL